MSGFRYLWAGPSIAQEYYVRFLQGDQGEAVLILGRILVYPMPFERRRITTSFFDLQCTFENWLMHPKINSLCMHSREM